MSDRINQFVSYVSQNCRFIAAREAALGIILGLVSLTNSAQALEVAFEPDSRLPIVDLNVAIKRGAVTDPKSPSSKEGLTNFMGEMLLRGTQSRTKQQIDLALDQMGAHLEVETRAEAMIFRGAALSSQISPFLKLLREILTQPSFPEKEIKKLKLEIISGLQEELGHDASLGSRKFTQFLFKGHPYGKSIAGSIKDIESLTREDIQAHYNRLVREQFLLVAGTGDASLSDISIWTQELAAARPNTALSSEDQKILAKVALPKEAPQRRLLLVDKPDRTQTQIYIGQIGLLMSDAEFFPLYLGNYAFGGPIFSSILMEEIRTKRGWSYGANSNFRFGLQPRSWQVHLYPASKDTASALAYTLQLIDDLKIKGISQEKFDFAQKSLVNKSGFMYDTPKKRVENIILERTLNLPEGFMKTYGSQLQKLKLADVNGALKAFLKPDHLAISVLVTAKDLKTQLIQSAGVNGNQVEVVPYTEE